MVMIISLLPSLDIYSIQGIYMYDSKEARVSTSNIYRTCASNGSISYLHIRRDGAMMMIIFSINSLVNCHIDFSFFFSSLIALVCSCSKPPLNPLMNPEHLQTAPFALNGNNSCVGR